MGFDLGIASMSGGFKSVFVHGALKGLKTQDIQGDIFGACSSSTIPMIFGALSGIGSTEY